jgi:tRNA/rRNA methyltransferase
VSRLEELLGRVSIVLLGPKYPENIGSAARAAHNMGIEQLVVVGKPLSDPEQALKTATHNAAHLVRGIRWCDSLAEALAEYSLVVGTTARQGRQRMSAAAPCHLAELILPTLDRGKVALLFGPEDKGLANRDLTYCGQVVTIPTASRFSSLNLAQAVAICCYELHQGLARLMGAREKGLYSPRTASLQELSAMVEAATLASQALDQAGGQRVTTARLRHLRQAVSRLALSAREVKLLKDACNQVVRVVKGKGEEG